MKYKILNTLIYITFLFFFAALIQITVYASEFPDLDRQCSVFITMQSEQEPVSGGTITLYQAARIQKKDGNCEYIYTEDFLDMKEPSSDIRSEEAANHFADYTEEHNVSGNTIQIDDMGRAEYQNLEPGLYLVVQKTAAVGYSKAEPFLVTLPMWQDGQYIYEVDASPKIRLMKSSDPTPASTPVYPDSSLPQTDQLWWPVPLLTVLGTIFFTLGWFRSKRYEL